MIKNILMAGILLFCWSPHLLRAMDDLPMAQSALKSAEAAYEHNLEKAANLARMKSSYEEPYLHAIAKKNKAESNRAALKAIADKKAIDYQEAQEKEKQAELLLQEKRDAASPEIKALRMIASEHEELLVQIKSLDLDLKRLMNTSSEPFINTTFIKPECKQLSDKKKLLEEQVEKNEATYNAACQKLKIQDTEYNKAKKTGFQVVFTDDYFKALLLSERAAEDYKQAELELDQAIQEVDQTKKDCDAYQQKILDAENEIRLTGQKKAALLKAVEQKEIEIKEKAPVVTEPDVQATAEIATEPAQTQESSETTIKKNEPVTNPNPALNAQQAGNAHPTAIDPLKNDTPSAKTDLDVLAIAFDTKQAAAIQKRGSFTTDELKQFEKKQNELKNNTATDASLLTATDKVLNKFKPAWFTPQKKVLFAVFGIGCIATIMTIVITYIKDRLAQKKLATQAIDAARETDNEPTAYLS